MTKFCTECGAPLDEGASFCTNCGSAIEIAEGSLTGSGAVGAAAGTAAGAFSSQPAVTSDPTMTMPASDLKAAAPAPMPAASMTPPPYTSVTPAPYTPPQTQPMQPQPMPTAPYGQPPAPTNNNKTWLIVGIAAAAVIVVAAIVIAFVVLGGGSGEKYRVSFDTTGGSAIASSEVAAGTQINEPASPTRTGYTFDGWYLDSTYTSKVSFPYAVNEETVMYAKWKEDASSAASTGSTSNTTTQPSTTTTPSSTATLTCVGSDGTTRTATIHRSGTSQRVFPDSNTRRLSQSEINALSDAEKCIAWNEIIAASNGYSFKNSGLRNYFKSCSWYHEDPSASAGGSLTKEAQDNVNALQASVDSWWMHLAAN